MRSKPATYFDTPERSNAKQIQADKTLIDNYPLIQNLLESFPEIALILNENRQIVACNQNAIAGFGKSSLEQILGKRVGEAICCIHSNDMGENTCGTSKFCAQCGSANAIKFTRENLVKAIEECRITSQSNGKQEAYDFLVTTNPLQLNGRNFTVFAVRDISNEKRRLALERIFFHDVLNTAAVVNSISSILHEEEGEDFEILLQSLKEASDQLIQEIQSQRDLRNAEDGNLTVDIVPVKVNEILERVYKQYSQHSLSEGKKLVLNKIDDSIFINTDKQLLIRSFSNLVKNAVEASASGDKIEIYAATGKNCVVISVKNPTYIPESTQLQIFNRSFTTKKGSGRGIGTYSVKLLVEQYLNGEVSFTSDKNEGTIFNIKIEIEKDNLKQG